MEGLNVAQRHLRQFSAGYCLNRIPNQVGRVFDGVRQEACRQRAPVGRPLELMRTRIRRACERLAHPPPATPRLPCAHRVLHARRDSTTGIALRAMSSGSAFTGSKFVASILRGLETSWPAMLRLKISVTSTAGCKSELIAAVNCCRWPRSARLLQLDDLTVGIADPDLHHVTLRTFDVVDPR